MSTQFIIYKEGFSEVQIEERDSRFCLDLYDFPRIETHFSGPQHMEADETLRMAAKIIYAVWCSHPDKADALVAALADDIPNANATL
jgi:hypothetical protein